MWQWLLFYGLALYGAVMLTRQSVASFRSRQQRPRAHPLTLILVVTNAEQVVEGAVRSLLLRTQCSLRERRIAVIDFASSDATAAILCRLEDEFPALGWVTVRTESEFLEHLQMLCLNSERVGCIYDLRDHDLLTDAAHDLTALCH